MIITEIQYFFSKIIRFQAIFKDTVEFTCALEFKISSQPLSKNQILGKKEVKIMSFFTTAVTGLKTVVTAIGAGVAVWGVINLLEGYGNDNPGANAHG